MSTNQLSGHCRSIVFFTLVLLALCVTADGAATVNPNIVYSKVTPALQIMTTIAPSYAICPAGYDCMTEADAAAQLGTYAKYSDAVCGYRQNTATLTAVIRTPQYCVKKAGTQNPVTCPDGCSCMLESDAKAKFGSSTRCSESPCNTITTGSAQLSAYCFRQGTTTTTPAPTCPEGCSCVSDATAKAKGGTWSRCSDTICGYEQSSATLAAVVQVPKYCQKQVSTTPICPEGCVCLADASAKERYGTYTRCQEDPCGYETSTAAIAAYQIPKYCVKQGSTPVCPDGCACISDEDAKLKGLTERCDSSQTPCGYRSADATANTAAQRIPLYCYKVPTTTPTSQVCKEGCYCLQEADAKLKFGQNNYTRCQADICGYDPSVTTANGIPKYCFKPTTPAPQVCPQGCNCTTDEIARKYGATPCHGQRTSCGYNADKQPLYCFDWSSAPACAYDYQKNTCSGTCPQGYSCGLSASRKDAAGNVVYGVCGCTGLPATPCAYDAQKNACTGTCQSGADCSVVGRNVDEKTGAVTPVCGCPQQSTCSYNYDKEACVGTCTVTGENCQLNTIYRDPTTGKVTYAECHCKSGGDTTSTCACDAASGSCSGTCASGKACTLTERTTDNSGKVVCTSCGCTDSCVLDASNRCSGTCSDDAQCTSITTKDDSGQEKVSCGCGGSQAGSPAGAAARSQGILEAIGSFFNELFGGK